MVAVVKHQPSTCLARHIQAQCFQGAGPGSGSGAAARPPQPSSGAGTTHGRPVVPCRLQGWAVLVGCLFLVTDPVGSPNGLFPAVPRCSGQLFSELFPVAVAVGSSGQLFQVTSCGMFPVAVSDAPGSC